MVGRFARGIVIGAACAATLVTNAGAQTCFTMQAEMMHLRSRASGPSDQMRYDRAYREQQSVLARTESRARQAGCFCGGVFLFRRSGENCDVLLPKIQEMQDNLARLDQMRQRGGASDVNDRLRELEGMMSARGCDMPGGDYKTETEGTFTYEPRPATPSYGNGTYRTLCVRTCDGYYFPVSFSTTSEHFPEDARTCEALCPGTETRLFYYENPGGGPENMTAITGEPYSSLPNAFKYRTSIDSACTCHPAGSSTVATTTTTGPGGLAVADDPSAPLPRARPAPGEDPETIADRIGYYVPHAAAAPEIAGPTSIGPDGRPVRVVGPAYWGDNKDQDSLVIAPVPN
jgi:hypothetical protein